MDMAAKMSAMPLPLVLKSKCYRKAGKADIPPMILPLIAKAATPVEERIIGFDQAPSGPPGEHKTRSPTEALNHDDDGQTSRSLRLPGDGVAR